MGLEGKHVPGTVVLLVLAGLLVLANNVVLVIIDVYTADQSDLRPVIHDLAIEIQHRCPISNEDPSTDQLIECLASLSVNPWIVGVHTFGEVDVGAADVKEAVRIAFCQQRRLLPVDHVVGHAGNLSSQLRLRSNRIKGIESHLTIEPE
jgi:hypothetical protein